MSDFNCNISTLKENNETTSSKPVRKNKRFLCSSTPKGISNKKLRITRYSPSKNSPEAISMTISIPRPDFLPLNLTFTTEKVKNKITLEMIRDNVLIPVEISDFIEDGKKLDKQDQVNDVSVLNFFSVVVRESEKIPIELIKCPDNLQLQINVLPETSVEDSEPIVVLEKSLSEYNFSCPRQGCRETFFRLSRLITHMENCIDEILLASIKITPIKCPECQQKFILKDLLSHFSKKHLLLNWYFGQIDQGNWAICQNYKCAKYMDQVDDIVEHFRSCDYLWQCKHCSVEFRSESKVRKHRCCTTSEDDSDETQKELKKTERDPCKNKYLAAKIKALKAKLNNKKGSKTLNKSCVSEVSVNKEHSECTNGHTKELMFTETVNINTTQVNEANAVGQNKGALEIVREKDNGQNYKHFKKKKEKLKISASSCETQEQMSQPKTYALDLDNWSKHFLEFNFICPIIGCNDSFFLPWQLFKHLRKTCSKAPSVKEANKIIEQLESMKFPCLISSCKKYNEMFVLQEYCYHYKSTHLILFKLLYHASRGTGQCFNYKCSAKITTSKEALIHSEECKFLWRCEKCQLECQHFASKRNHICTKEIISEESLVSLDGKRKKRKSATIAINKLNELVAEISDIKEEKNNLEERGAREDDDFVASSAASVSSNDEEPFNNELEVCSENIKNRVMKRTSTLIFKDIQFYKTWLKENISTGVLFPEWLPTIECLKVMNSNECSLHIPSFSCIRNIEVEYFTGINSNRTKESHSAELFKPFPELQGSETLGFNAGGPVWGLSWCPTIDGEDQILAVSTHKTFAEHYGIVNMVAAPGCIQIWNLGKLKKKNSTLPRLSICICHSYGPIYSFEWCPSGCYTRDAGVKRIGLLAIACGDGKVRILSIPDPSNLSYNEPIFANLDPVITLLPQKLDAIEQIKTGMALCVTWMPSCGHSKIAAGYGDGGLRIWDLNTSSIFLKVTDQGKPALLPIQYIDAHSYSLRSVAWCPYNKNIIATGSGDKCLKVFDVNNPHLPVYCSKRESVFHIEWPKNRIGLFVSSDTCFNVLPGSARYLVLDYFFNPQKAEADSIHLTTRHNAAVLCCSYNNHLDLIATCDVAGEVVVSKDQDKPSTKIMNSNLKIEPVYHIVAECSDELSIDETNADEATEITDEYIESLNVADQYKKLGPKIEKEFQITRFKFVDSNKFEFSKTRLRNDPDVLRTARNETMSTAVLEKMETRAVHRVTWNQNDGYHTWLASGTRLGVVRLHNFKAWT